MARIMIAEALKEFKNSKNKIYVVLKHRNFISGGFAVLTIVFGTIGFWINNDHPVTGILNSIKMFGLDFPSKLNETNIFIFLAIISALITISLVAVIFFIKESLDNYLIRSIFKKDHVAVFGLGEVSLSFLNSYSQQKGQKDIAIIESDANNLNLEKFRKKGMGVFVGDALNDRNLGLLNFNTMQSAIIALGNDRVNIELAKKIINLYEKNKIETPIKLIVHIQNRDLDFLFHQKFILPDEDKPLKVDVKTFSFYQEVAKDLFEHHSIDGETEKFIVSYERINNILIGDGELVKNIIHQMALISHFPNENIHTVSVVDKEADQLVVEIKKHLYYQPENFPTFKIEAISLDSNNLNFFSNEIWKKENVANVIIAFDDEAKNLDLTVELYNRTYLSSAIDNAEMPKILFAIYDQLLLSDIVNINQEAFRNFYTFGNSDKVLCHENLIEEEKDLLAKLINAGYGDLYNPEKLAFDEIATNNKWYNVKKYSDKLSSIAQAYHIDLKLKSMGLKKQKNTQVSPNKNELLKLNRKLLLQVFDNERKSLEIGEEALKEYSKELDKFWAKKSYEVKYFPKAFTTLFEKMIRMEHNRWNAYHYLNGWKYGDIKNKSKKEHDCLLPLKDFDKDYLQITVIYDIYSFLYLPNYLAEAGYEIVPANGNAKGNKLIGN
jgi:hypothetical protein